MSKILWKSLLLSPAILGATLVVSSSAIALEQPQQAEGQQDTAQAPATDYVVAITDNTDNTVEQNTTVSAQIINPSATQPQTVAVTQVSPAPITVAQATTAPVVPATAPEATSVESLDELNRYSNEGRGNVNSVAQVTSVSQLSDVQPTDWAFQALQSLVERYGVIAGYPDGTYRGNRAMTRYEFAAGLNAALDRVNELIAAGTADMVRREDLATLQRLQEEFAAELATLRGRVDALEAQTAELEANQFSTTTKLVGEAIVAVTDTFGDDVEDNTVLQNRVRLDFQTSFGGSDVLHTRLSTGNAQPFSFSAYNPAVTPFKTFEGTQTFNVSPNFENDVFVDWLAYDFPLFGQARGYIAAVGGIHSDYAATTNPYFEDYDGGRGALSTFAQQNPIYRIGGGAGAGLTLAFGGSGVLRPSSLTVGYLADNASDPALGAGLADGDYAALAQLNFNLGDRVALAATYVHGYHTTGNGIFDIGGSFDSSGQSAGPIVGTIQANNPSALLPTGDVPTVTNSYGVSAALRLSDRISLSGFGTYTNATLLGRGNGDIWTFGGGVAFPDLGKEGNLLGIFAGVEPTLRGLDAPGVVGFERDYGLHVEGFYRYQLTDNVSITPGVIWLSSPGQNNDNSDVVIGTLRTTFNF
ncbi:iron uptake porin [Gloeocapsopsis crepidinum LEGE 06123]|uniref:Iron uptake porin n=1 Tax=Gloeocapsopsis crepidinum LEGE 06123 TaxID=588587 RepID=A0ABR9UVU2_9CHRO|nr:iron uptake porin [Gloeocapsopsis crepidinum]MBE9191695.1 iron uptake porin [Gloeocapsopsis crepidinum LEGE 06123]